MTQAYINGKFYTGNGRFAQAVLVADGRFALIGNNGDILAAAGGNVVDLGGRTVLPGFNDSHMHLYSVGVQLNSLKLGDCTSIADCITAGRAYLEGKRIPPGRPVLGYLWNQESFTDERRNLTRHDLDKISTAHPILALRACSHIVSCNTMALKMAGITANTPDPQGGEIGHDADGTPNGVLAENAMELISGLADNPTIDEMTATIKAAMTHASRHGITSVQTNDVRDGNWQNMLAAYGRLYDQAQDQAPLRTNHQCFFSTPAGLRDFITSGNITGRGNDMHKIGPLKMFVDGSLGGRTAALQHPYNDAPHTSGILTMTSAQLDEMIQIAHAAGMSCVIHAIGDGAMALVLAAYEKVISGGNNRLRHGIIHCQITDTPILKRMAASNVLALVQPIFLHTDIKMIESRVGADRAATSYAWGTMDSLGIPVSYGTDAPIEGLCPIR
ncbi:MAG: amidohydrolase, partial [Defluviitaleaceae bacterium]|nr:amidohydrolase [Defluviitaleaceae bacterium]